MIPLDLKEFRKVARPVGDRVVTWTIGFVPNGKFDELTARVSSAFGEAVGDTPRPVDRTIYDAAMRELCRWGLRANDAGFPMGKGSETFAGVAYDVLDDVTLDVLQRVDGGAFVGIMGAEVLTANRLTEADILGFR